MLILMISSTLSLRSPLRGDGRSLHDDVGGEFLSLLYRGPELGRNLRRAGHRARRLKRHLGRRRGLLGGGGLDLLLGGGLDLPGGGGFDL